MDRPQALALLDGLPAPLLIHRGHLRFEAPLFGPLFPNGGAEGDFLFGLERGDDVHVLLRRARSAHAALVVTRGAGAVIEDRPQAVAAPGPGVPREPFPREELPTIDRRGLRASPGLRPPPGGE